MIFVQFRSRSITRDGRNKVRREKMETRKSSVRGKKPEQRVSFYNVRQIQVLPSYASPYNLMWHRHVCEPPQLFSISR